MKRGLCQVRRSLAKALAAGQDQEAGPGLLAMWIRAATVDLKAHVLRGQEFAFVSAIALGRMARATAAATATRAFGPD